MSKPYGSDIIFSCFQKFLHYIIYNHLKMRNVNSNGVMIMKSFIVILTLVLITGCLFPVAQSPRGIILTFGDYTLLGVRESFDALNLKEHIPEDARIFVEFGVDSCLVAEFMSDTGKYYNIDLYSFLSPKGALGTYHITDIPGSQPFKLGYFARKNDETVQFIKGHYIVTVNSAKDGTIEEAVKLAADIARRIEGGRIKPDIYEMLPKTNMVKNSELYFTGPRAFENRFSPELSRALKIESSLEGTAAKYKINRTNVDLIKIHFPGRRESLEAVDSYLKTRADRPVLHSRLNLNYHTVIERDRSEVFIAESGDKFYIMLGATSDIKDQNFFEYILRGGN